MQNTEIAETEFIIALTEHRYLGLMFVPLFIQKNGPYYTIISHVLPGDLKNTAYKFQPWEKELVEITDKYSDLRLARKFSRETGVTHFFASLTPDYFSRHVSPFIEQQMFKVALILMVSPVRLFKKENKYANLYDEDEIKVSPVFGRPVFHFERMENETRYRLNVFLAEKELPLINRDIKIVSNEPCLMVYRDTLVVFEMLNAKRLIPFFQKNFVSVPRNIEDKYYAGFVLNAVRDFEVHTAGFRIENVTSNRRVVLSFEKSLKYEPVFVLQFFYGGEKFLPGSNRKVSVSLLKEGGSYVFRKLNRDFKWERNIIEFLSGLSLKEKNGYFAPSGTEVLEGEQAFYFVVDWIGRQHKVLQEHGIYVVQDKLDKKYFTGEHHIEVKTKAAGDWFDIYVQVRFGEFQIPFVKLKKYILNDIREFELPNGETAVLPDEWFARYRGLLPFARIHGNQLQFEKYHFTLVRSRLAGADKSLSEKFRALEFDSSEAIELPQKLKAKLRSYQEEGFRWMYQLNKNGFGGCLADDMGLGKTLQTLTLLLKLKRLKNDIKISSPEETGGQLSLFGTPPEAEHTQPASLIVVPTSLVHNWENEIKKFTPELKVYGYLGMQRKNAVEMDEIVRLYDVILTTYGTVRNDIKLLENTLFFYAILDESQLIKNPSSKTFKAVISLKAQHRLVLTGTPIENSLSDMWSQMHFLNRGMLGNPAFFQRYFMTPIEKHNSEEQKEKLQLMIRPFILRRKKEEVARDLPPLMEQVLYCEMTGGQRKIYETEKSIIRNTILENIDKEGIKKSSFIILQGLTKLRQLANHPLLVKQDSTEDSGKLDEIIRMLQDLMAENHKVLIFSSFVSHLKLIREQIERQNWGYSMLTGQTTGRKEVIEQFQGDPQNRIFLISLKAGGVGLNLTQADYVFIVDPWWNPAAENQAISRAHRIGQDKHVFVYRFISEDTIEEKIERLKERKSALAEKFINSNNPFEGISKEEIVQLFK